jgi:osmotically inducible protein OsmC
MAEAAQRRARAIWEGTLAQGSGTVTLESSGLGGVLPATWASRTARADGKTSPEELIAAAHATCFSMGLSHGLTEAGTPPTKLETEAVCTFAPGESGYRIAAMALKVKGTVPGVDAATFAAAAEQARDGCPVSQALKGNVELSVEAELV